MSRRVACNKRKIIVFAVMNAWDKLLDVLRINIFHNVK